MAKKAVTKQTVEPVEEPVVEQPQDPANWQMPKPKRGQVVVFYARSIVSAQNADIGFVSRIGMRSIDIAYRNQGLSDCYHVDDPRLKANPDLKLEVNGLWDWCDEDKEIKNRLAELERRLDQLES
jgi:hypothetical protein